MTPIERFVHYAADFEKSFVDDDWARVEAHFGSDATYEVTGAAFACHLKGPAAISEGFRKSLDGLDRRFDSRSIERTDGPTLTGDEVRVEWIVTYKLDGHPDFKLVGASVATIVDDRIQALRDEYTDEMDRATAGYLREHAPDFDPSYC